MNAPSALLLAACLAGPAASRATEPGSGPRKAEPLDLPGVENAFRLTDRLLSGGSPAGDEAYAGLAAQGVKWIISVDGARPDLEAARRLGLRYVHLPVGYDGLRSHQTLRLLQAAAASPGPVFIHCHHGRHRGVAAAALVARQQAGWTAAEAEAFLRAAGTSPDYPGLYACVRDFAPVSLPPAPGVDFPGEQPPEPLVETMLRIDALHDRLKGPDGPRPADAILLLEEYREMRRLKLGEGHGPGYALRAEEALSAAGRLEGALREGRAAADALAALRRSCRDCHREFRD